VTRGRRLLARAWLKRWPAELGRANRDKRGRPYVLPPIMAPVLKHMLASMRLSWRALEGILREMLNVKAQDHTTIWKRLTAEEAAPAVPSRDGVVAAADATGFSTTLRGEWMRDHRHRRAQSADRRRVRHAGQLRRSARARHRGGHQDPSRRYDAVARPQPRSASRCEGAQRAWSGRVGGAIRTLAALDDRVRVLGREENARRLREVAAPRPLELEENKFWTWNEMRRADLFN
jgi:hypothetical protein